MKLTTAKATQTHHSTSGGISRNTVRPSWMVFQADFRMLVLRPAWPGAAARTRRHRAAVAAPPGGHGPGGTGRASPAGQRMAAALDA